MPRGHMESECGKRIENQSQAIDHATECCSVGRVREEPVVMDEAAQLELADAAEAYIQAVHDKDIADAINSSVTHWPEYAAKELAEGRLRRAIGRAPAWQ